MAISDEDIDLEIKWLHRSGEPVTVNAVRVRSGGSPARIKARIAVYFGGPDRVPKRSPKTAAQRQHDARNKRQRELQELQQERGRLIHERDALMRALRWCRDKLPPDKQTVITERWPVLKRVLRLS